MLTRILRCLKGYVKIQIKGYSPERFLNLCRYHDIPVWGLRPAGRSYEMYVSVQGFRKVRPLLRKTDTKVHIVKKCGLPFFLFRYRKRKMFFAGFAGCIALVYVLSLFVWDIRIEGNFKNTDETILAWLRKQDIACGMRRSQADCSRISKMLRKQFADIIWVSASLEGSRITIAVKENSDSRETKDTGQKTEGTDLIAEKDGTIKEILTRSGDPKVHAGDKVRKGELLVSGKIEIKNDSQEVTGYQYQQSDADILMETTQQYEDVLELKYREKNYDGNKKRQLYIKTDAKEYTAGNRIRAGKGREIHSSEVRLRFSKSFQLPFSVGVRTARSYQNTEKTYSEAEYREILSGRFERFCKDLRKKGVQILENDVKIYREKDCVKAKGTLTLLEQCGKERKTEHGNLGKSN